MSRKLRMGMVGGSLEAFIGGVHRIAAAIDGQIELVAGAFSSSPEKSKATGKALYLDESRVYGSYEEMITAEKALPDDQRIDFISIVTPNHLHFGPAKLALESGFHVICDKPMTLTSKEAEALEQLVAETGLVFALTHNYTGYPMVKQAKEMIAKGEIGQVRKIIVEYPQGWLSARLEDTGNKQASWRTDPSKSGAGGGLGDIGTHAENLAEYVTGAQISALCADLSIFVEGRPLDDDGNILLRFNNGAKGVLHYSQIANGEENSLNIRVYGETGGLEWRQMEPNSLVHKTNGSYRVLRTNWGELHPSATAHARIPAGHPEGFLEAFANIYRNFAYAIKAYQDGKPHDTQFDFPTVHDGVRGLRFMEAALASSRSETKWTSM